MGYPVPSARAAVRCLGGDSLDRDVGKIRGPSREANDLAAGSFGSGKIGAVSVESVFGFRYLLHLVYSVCDRNGCTTEQCCCAEEKMGHTRCGRGKGKWVRTKERGGREKWRGEGCHKMPGGLGGCLDHLDSQGERGAAGAGGREIL